MISVFSLYTWDLFGKVVSGLLGYYSGNVDVIPSQNLLIIAKVYTANKTGLLWGLLKVYFFVRRREPFGGFSRNHAYKVF